MTIQPEDQDLVQRLMESDEALYACDICKRVGFTRETQVHQEVTGHVSRRVSDTEAKRVRAIWKKELQDHQEALEESIDEESR